MAYTNSGLATYKRLTSNKTSPRNHEIDCITIHCYVGQVTAKQGCDYFATTDRQVSSNYVVGKDGSIGLSVEEKDRAWTSANSENDHRAVTIEVACDSTSPYAVTTAAYNALINLVADICKRNNIKELKWKADKSLIGQVDKQNMTVHRWFANTACPGDYLYGKHADIAKKVNEKLGVVTSTSTPVKKEIYRVRKTWADASSQIGAFESLGNAKKACKSGYSVFDSNGKIVYSVVTATKTDNFLPARGYFKKGDVSVNVGKIASFMRKTFPLYTSRAALGNIYGDNLIKAVKEFQRRTGLEPDGYLGKLTLAKLEEFGFKR